MLPRFLDALNVVQLRPRRDVHPAENRLCFIQRRKPKGGGIDYWNVSATGDYVQDYATGKALAREYLTCIREHPTIGNTTLLGCIVGDMVKRVEGGRLRGTEIAFLRGINEASHIAAVYAPHLLTEMDPDLGSWS